MTDRDDSAKAIPVRRYASGEAFDADDHVAVEEPMEIRVQTGPEGSRAARSLSITMRTPGHDFELAAGFLFTEGILEGPEQIRGIDFCGPPAPGRSTSNIVRVDLSDDVELDLDRLQRNFFASSSCGICGKATLDALHVPGLTKVEAGRPLVPHSVLHGLPDRLRASQPLFDRTGGIHAAALADTTGKILTTREDVGRHNAVDKVLGRAFLDGQTRLSERVLVISGRASFEILQKALRGSVPVIVAVGAASSLAVEIAERFGMTLVGFTSTERFNVYTGAERIIEA